MKSHDCHTNFAWDSKSDMIGKYFKIVGWGSQNSSRDNWL